MKNGPFKPAKEDTISCRACCTAISYPLVYFCLNCWNLVPGDERAGLYALHHRGQNTASKVEKLCRIIAKKQQTKNEKHETDPHQGH